MRAAFLLVHQIVDRYNCRHARHSRHKLPNEIKGFPLFIGELFCLYFVKRLCALLPNQIQQMTEIEIDKLKTNLQEDIEGELTKKYFLLRRTGLWAFLGGIFAFAVAVGVVSHQTALKAVTDPAVEAAKRSIINNEKTATHAVVMIKQNLEASRSIEERIKALEIGIPPAQRAKIIAEARAAEEEAARKKAESEPRKPESHR